MITVSMLTGRRRVNLVLLLVGNFIQITPSMEVLLIILYLIVLWKKMWSKTGGLLCFENAVT